MRIAARRGLYLVLAIACLADAANAGWPFQRARRQAVQPPQQSPVTPPTPQVDLGSVPRYPYGYFGARSDGYHVYHRSYYGDYMDWSFRRGP
jgi:hypothetical protein